MAEAKAKPETASAAKGRVTGIGGVFFKSKDPKALAAWYRDHLGMDSGHVGFVKFGWREKDNPSEEGATAWTPFPESTTKFGSGRSHMINYRVDDLDAVLAQLRKEGVAVDDKRDDGPFGRFGWATDLEGNKFELWEPPKKKAAAVQLKECADVV